MKIQDNALGFNMTTSIFLESDKYIMCKYFNSQYDCTTRTAIVVNLSAAHAVGRGFTSRPVHTKDHHINGTSCPPTWNVGFMTGFRLCKRPGSVFIWLCG